jgi:predicted RNA-binding protein (TIGR00451 family)
MYKVLNKKDIKKLNEDLSYLEVEFSTKDKVELKDNCYVLNRQTIFIIHNQGGENERYLPHLKTNYYANFPSVYVDKGAIRFVVNGADLMVPGISELDEFEKNNLVVIRDAEHKKALAIGLASFSSNEIKEMKKGKVIQNLHFVGDKYW